MRILLACLISVATATATAAGADPSLSQVMESLAKSPGFQADYREIRRLALLTTPLESQGTLYFAPPDRFARHVRSPDPAVLVIEGSRMRSRDALGTDEFDLAASPTAMRAVGQMTRLLRGDLEGMRKDYRVEFASDGDRWQLSLHPKGQILKRVVGVLTLHGVGDRLDEMVTETETGDRVETSFANLDRARRFSSEEIERIFSIGP